MVINHLIHKYDYELLQEVFVQWSGSQFYPLLFSILLYISRYMHIHACTYKGLARMDTHTHTHTHVHARARA